MTPLSGLRTIAVMRPIATLLLLVAWAAGVAPGPRFRVAVGGIFAESNAFYPASNPIVLQPTLPREQWLEAAARGRSVVAGQIEAAPGQGLDLHQILTGSASFLGVVEGASFEANANELVRQLKEATPPFHGVFLNLHGAMVVDGHPQGDAELVRRVRVAMGPDYPIVVLHDFHANVSPEVVRDSTVLITYKEHPHVDTTERGAQSAKIMGRLLRKEIAPVQALAKPALVVNLIHQNTFTGPLSPIVAESRRLEETDPRVLAVSVPGGYQWADVPFLGPSVVVVTDGDRAFAEREAERLSSMVYRLRDQLVFDAPDAAAAVREAMLGRGFPVVLMDTGDNIGGGSAGDSAFVLRELLRQSADGWVVSMKDAAAVDEAARTGIGRRFDFPVGAKHDTHHGEPVRIHGIVRSLHTSTGQTVGAGPVESAVIAVGDAAAGLVILTRRPSGLRLRNELTRHGIGTARARIIVSKGTVAPYDTFKTIAARFILAASPGPTDVDLSRFTFTRARRPLAGLP